MVDTLRARARAARLAGLPNSDNNRTLDMFLKTRYLQERNEGRGVVFATGTPISNTLAEMYTMLRYLQIS
jgi:N12 class adenine-specific DNA methylase